jgi:ethanolamine ammonia-lyase large subunit
MLQFSTNLQGDRVLKFVQELIEKETQNLRPGGFLLKTNADAIASLEALRNGFEQAMQIESAKLTEYGGNSSGYRENQVTSARERMDQMKVLYNEILAFERGFASPAQGPGAVTRTDADQSLGTARSQILQMRRN